MSSVMVFYPSLDRDEVVGLLRKRLPELAKKLPLVKAVLFGSYAKGNFTVASGVDSTPRLQGAIAGGCLRRGEKDLAIPKLEVHVYSEEEHQRLRETIRRMEADGIVAFERKGEG